MKKLMIALAAVAVAAGVQAANINWGFGTVYGIGADGKGYDAEGFNGTADIQLIIGSTFDDGVIGGIIYDAVTENVAFAYGYNAEALTPLSVNMAVDTPYYSQVVLTSGDSTLKSGVFQISNDAVASGELYPNWGGEGESSGIFDSSEATLPRVSTFTETYGAFSATGWQSAPEPTSGLLLLIGVAGLALRRRRA